MRRAAIGRDAATIAPPLATTQGVGGWPIVAAGWRNTRENLIAKAQSLLEPGEVVAHVVRALDGRLNRWLGVAIALVLGLPLSVLLRVPLLAFVLFLAIFTSLFPRRLIFATDRALVVIQCGRWRFTPKAVLDRLDIETRIGPLRGFWRATTLNGRRYYIVPRTFPEVQAADADVDAA
jgi:hypothetical protein